MASIKVDLSLGKDDEDDKVNPHIPMEIENNLKSMPIMPETSPLKTPDFVDKPGFFRTLAHAAADTNEIINVGTALAHTFSHKAEETPDGWSPVDDKFELFKTVNEKYWGRLANATGPDDQQKILESIRGQEHDDEFYANGSFAATLIGGIGGGVLSPSSLIPFAATVKYANLGSRVLANTARVAPSLAISAAAHEAATQVGHDSFDVSDLAFDTMRDTIFGSALLGAGIGLGKGFEGYKMYRGKQTLNAVNEGVTIEPNIKNGIFQNTYTVVPSKGQSVSAAVVDKWQEVFDNSLVMEGAFAIPVIGNLFTKLNPVVRGLNHSYGTIRMWTNKIVDHSLNIEGVKKGIARGANAEELILDIRHASKMMDFQIKGAWYEELGIDSSTQGVRRAKAFQQKINADGYTSLAEFKHKVQGIIINEEPTSSKAANNIAAEIRKHLDSTWERFRKALDLPEGYLPPATARAYLMKNYDVDAISQFEDKWITTITNHLKEQDAEISKLHAPVDAANERLQEMLEFKKLVPADQAQQALKIEAQRKKISQLKKDLNDELRDNSDHAILLDKRNVLSTDDVKEINQLNEATEVIKKEAGLSQKAVTDLRDIIARAKRSIEKSKTAKTTAKNTEILENAEKDLDAAITKRDIDATKLMNEQAELSGLIQEGLIPERLFIKSPETGFTRLRNVEEDAPVLRKIFEDDDARIGAAQSWGETITGHTPEQVNASIMAKLVPQTEASSMKARTLMIPDNILHDAGFLSNNLSGNIATYDLTLGKVSAMREVFPDLHNESPLEYISRLLVEERKDKRLFAKANSKPDQLNKDLAKIDTQFKSAKSFAEHSYDILMGKTTGSLRAQQMTGIVRNFTISTLLGAVPLSQIADMGGLILKNGIYRYLRDGLVPLLKSAATGFKGEFAHQWKQDAAHANLAVEHILAGHMEKNFNPLVAQDDSYLGKTATGMKKLAELSGNFYGTTYIDNQLQAMSAHMTQSKIMEYMYKFKDGTLKKPELENLLRSGIDPKEWADKFIKNFNSTGEKSSLGAYNSRWFDWSDDVAKNVMGRAIKRTLRETILKRGILDNPFFSNSPMPNLMLLFKGWVFSATSRYTLPLLQHGEAKDLMSIMFSLAAGSLVDPLRRLARGEDIDYNIDGAFIAALGHGGTLGYIYDAAETANALSGQFFYKNGDKYQQRAKSGMLLGPSGSSFEGAQKLLSAYLNNEIDERTAKNGMKLIPLSQAWYLRYLSSKFVEGLELPKTKADARAQSAATQGLF